MRTLRKNEQKMLYALQGEKIPIYQTDIDGNIIYDHYEDSDGNWIYLLDDDGKKIPLPTGEYSTGYSEAVEFKGNLAMSGGEVEAKEFGLDVSGYDAVLIVKRGKLPIDETSVIWTESEVGYLDGSTSYYPSRRTYPNKSIYPKFANVDPATADYRVVAVKPSLNVAKYILKRITK